jgi:hypothetical protein
MVASSVAPTNLVAVVTSMVPLYARQLGGTSAERRDSRKAAPTERAGSFA